MIARAALNDPTVQGMLSRFKGSRPGTQALYDGIPMSNMSWQKRGLRIQAMGLAIDQMLHPQAAFSATQGNRGSVNAAEDWVRDTTRVELKTSSLHFVKRDRGWGCCFSCLKPKLFDELWLVIYSQIGLHFHRSTATQDLNLSCAGVRTQVDGFHLQVLGPYGEEDPFGALAIIQGKLECRGFKSIAVVHWEHQRTNDPRCWDDAIHPDRSTTITT